MPDLSERLDEALSDVPIVAILRGIEPEDAIAVSEIVFAAGIRVIEVPLNSPRPFESIERLASAFAGRAIVGAGTVLSADDARAVAASGGKIAVAPNTDPTVIGAAIEAGVEPLPGWMTVSEALAAYAAGARHLKLFPASTVGAGHIAAARAVLPNDTRLLAVGGVGAENSREWADAGIDGYGIGSELYKPGRSLNDIGARANACVAALRRGQ
ncbi:MAG: 2-dehydro-3-deoxy-6-phosphogalactonate aldolase [Pseudomonadota bacterium]